ncbi:hypothetical protein F4679DRAFT_592441 [Xylaria curta]|nr:hypothetical protein F4679DRAFT_592441 [Xylaria curta]
MTSSLETLPVELVEMIANLLDFQDVASLRCTSRTIESKTLHAFHSTGCFYQKNIKLEMETLEKLAKLSNDENLTGRLQHCTIIGITGLTETECEVDEYIRLLTTIFCNLEKNIQTGSIVSLSLRVVLRITGPGIYEWERFWITTKQTFVIAMTALDESNLSVDGSLDLFSSVPFCSLSYDSFLLLGQIPSLAKNFKHLKRLTMSLSSPPNVNVPPSRFHIRNETLRQRGYVASTLEAILNLPAIMPELESLDFHWFRVGPIVKAGAQRPARRDISSFSTALALKECTLRGIYASESHLLQFITSTTPMTLRLMDTNLTTGTYDSIFQYITHANSQTTYCRFEHLYCLQPTLIHEVHFDIPDESQEENRWSTYLRYTFSPQMKKLGHEGIPQQLRPTFYLDRRAEEGREKQKFPEYGPPMSHNIAFSLEDDQPIDAELLDAWIDGRPGRWLSCTPLLEERALSFVTYTTRASRDGFYMDDDE